MTVFLSALLGPRRSCAQIMVSGNTSRYVLVILSARGRETLLGLEWNDIRRQTSLRKESFRFRNWRRTVMFSPPPISSIHIAFILRRILGTGVNCSWDRI
ncbi:hypothetical protein B0H11DRAFT_2076336, partial [Mycena galericulata]